MKTFTIELAAKFYVTHFNTNTTVLKVGDRFKSTKMYSGGRDDEGPVYGVITGRKSDSNYEVNEDLALDGYTEHEVYTVTFDNGDESVMWPEEVEAV